MRGVPKSCLTWSLYVHGFLWLGLRIPKLLRGLDGVHNSFSDLPNNSLLIMVGFYSKAKGKHCGFNRGMLKNSRIALLVLWAPGCDFVIGVLLCTAQPLAWTVPFLDAMGAHDVEDAMPAGASRLGLKSPQALHLASIFPGSCLMHMDCFPQELRHRALGSC